jgi:hydrogenase nickel incorporation protein HypA/HybF
MHEMSVAQNIIDIVQQHLPDHNTQTVKTVNVKIGKMAGIVPDSLEFSFQVIAADTPSMTGAVLKMHFVPVIIRCKDCTVESSLDDPFFVCPECGSVNVDTLSGTELQITEIEIEDSSQEVS